jgi:hypothetical protein
MLKLPENIYARDFRGKKPGLKIVKPPAADQFAPPTGLGKQGTKLLRSLIETNEIDDPGGRQMLFEICVAEDRADEYAAIIARDGPVIYAKQGPKDPPLVRHELACRSFIVRALFRLGLEIPPSRDKVGRPGQGAGICWRDLR